MRRIAIGLWAGAILFVVPAVGHEDTPAEIANRIHWSEEARGHLEAARCYLASIKSGRFDDNGKEGRPLNYRNKIITSIWWHLGQAQKLIAQKFGRPVTAISFPAMAAWGSSRAGESMALLDNARAVSLALPITFEPYKNALSAANLRIVTDVGSEILNFLDPLASPTQTAVPSRKELGLEATQGKGELHEGLGYWLDSLAAKKSQESLELRYLSDLTLIAEEQKIIQPYIETLFSPPAWDGTAKAADGISGGKLGRLANVPSALVKRVTSKVAAQLLHFPLGGHESDLVVDLTKGAPPGPSSLRITEASHPALRSITQRFSIPSTTAPPGQRRLSGRYENFEARMAGLSMVAQTSYTRVEIARTPPRDVLTKTCAEL